MRHFVGSFFCLSAGFLVGAVIPLHAQFDTLPQVGLSQLTPYQSSEYESVDLSTGNVNVHIPLVRFPQKGGKLRLNFVVRYNEPLWIVPSVTNNEDANGGIHLTGYWKLDVGSLSRPFGVDVVRDQGITGVASMTNHIAPDTSGDFHDNLSTVYSIRDRTGAQHPYRIDTSQGSSSSLAPDGSGWLSTSNGLTDKAGLSYSWVHPSGTPGTLGSWNITDPHGNALTVASDGWHDSLGKTIPGSWWAAGGGLFAQTGPAEDDPFPGVPTDDFSRCPTGTTAARTWIVPAATDAGGSATYSFCYSAMTLNTQFNVTTIAGLTGSSATEAQPAVVPLTAIVLPNGKSYTFTYDPHFGDITRIDLPTGGYIAYAYSVIGWDTCSTSMPVKRAVVSRTISDSASVPSTWHYRWYNGVCNGSGTPVVIVTNPDQNDEMHYAVDNTVNGGSLIRDVISYQGAATVSAGNVTGTLLKKVETTQTSNLSIFWVSTPDVLNDDGLSYHPGYLQRQYFTTPVVKSVTTMYAPDTQAIQTTQETDYTTVPSSGSVQWYKPDQNPYAPTQAGYSYGTCACINYSEITSETVHDYVTGGGNAGPILRQTQIGYRFQDTGGQVYADAGLTGLPSSVTISDGTNYQAAKTTYQYDETSYSAGAIAGEPTTTQRWAGGTGWVSSHTKFNASGVFAGSIDPRTTATNVTAYDCSNAFPSSVTVAAGTSISETSSYVHDCNTGAVTSHTDPNGQPTSYTYADSLNRITAVHNPDGGSVQVAYTDGPHLSVSIATATGGTQGPMDQTVLYDSLGRTTDVQTTAPEGTLHQTTTYDSMGRVWQRSNPYRSMSDAMGREVPVLTTTFGYDALGRKILEANPDGSAKRWSYTGNATSVTDESGHSKLETIDGLGRLTQVDEMLIPAGTPGCPGGCAFAEQDLTTLYTYDAQSNLATVSQSGSPFGSQTPRLRSFSYDSLSRLISSSNPETGTICYGTYSGSTCQSGYDANGNLLAKTDARGVIARRSYDSLNRLTNITYSDGLTPGEQLFYDVAPPWMPDLQNVIGRLSYSANDYGGGTTGKATAATYSYDVLGRTVRKWQQTPSRSPAGFFVSATYDLAGNTTSLTYPDGRTVVQNFDSAGRLGSVTSGTITSPGPAYVSSVTYNPDGSPNVETFGNGVQQTTTENSRLQVQSRLVASTLGGSPFSSHTYCYSGCATGGFANSGNIWGITDTLNSAKTQGFTYDSLNRITSFSVGGAVNQQYTTDSFGNMSRLSGGTALTTFDPTTNRINDLPCAASTTPFDSAGNQICDTDTYGGVRQYQYDAESRIQQISSLGSSTPFATYTYDVDGARVRKMNADGTYTEYVNFGGVTLAELDQTGSWWDYIYANGAKIAKVGTNENARLHLHGINSASGEFAGFSFSLNYVIKQGDKMLWRQYESNCFGGLALNFGGFNSEWNKVDSDGQTINSDTLQNQWHDRTFDLSGMTGLTTQGGWFTADTNTPGGTWDIFFADVTIVSTDGTITPVSTRNMSPTLSVWNQGGVSGQSWVMEQPPGSSAYSTTYYLSDHLGTAHMEFTAGGYPIWQGQFAPFGAEIDTQASGNHYKFTGKERDTESGLDYFGARYYGSSMGRFMTPDYSASNDGPPDAVPYGDLSNPQSLNLYSYVQNNPVSQTDPSGHDCIYGDGSGGGYVQRGDCTNAGGKDDNGVFVNGTVDVNSFRYNTSNNSSSYSFTPDSGANFGTGVLQGPNLNGGFDPGSLAAGVFGAANASTFNNAAGVANAAGTAELDAAGLFFPLTHLAITTLSGRNAAGVAAAGIARKPGSLGQFGDNVRENKVARDIIKELKLSGKNAEAVHDIIGEASVMEGRQLGYRELVAVVKSALGLL